MSLQDLSAKNIRKTYLEFFEGKGHKRLPSSSLLPDNDPSVLFTTAGMQQFKRFYDRPDEAPAPTIATCQKCIRTGDIEEVGDDTHLTFFEMLGNFSFGYPVKEDSYFKKEAISYAWEFLTEILGIDKSRISCTYFAGDRGISEDAESKGLLKEITGLDDAKILGTGCDETFWSLGSEGSPGGPTVEFYIDGVEVWNLVFNQYKMQNGEYVESEFKGIDTGMGFERLVAKLNDSESVFETDIFKPLIGVLESALPIKYDREKEDFRIVLDHLKASSFIIAEGMEPSNKGQGYVLRRLIRRLLMRSQSRGLGFEWVQEYVAKLAEIHPELSTKDNEISSILIAELNKFEKTIKNGERIIESLAELDAKSAFDLYQTYGFPFELSKEYAAMRNIKISDEDFQIEFARHKQLSRTASAGMFKGGLADDQDATRNLHTAAHLLLAALRKVLGDHVLQRGSNITSERLRFDFSHSEKMTDEQIKEVEDLVNDQIKAGHDVICEELPYEQAKESGAMGVFEDRYGEKVKVYSISDFSREICGGPHASNTADLGHFKITKEESSSSGVRRIKAVLE